MASMRREILGYMEFLRDCGNLYLEGGPEQEAQTAATPPVVKLKDAPLIHQTDLADLAMSGGGPEGEPLTESDRIERARKAAETVAACKKCPLWKGRAQAVYGVGSLMAKIVFVGEGPGAEEDRQGIPFVGRAGRLLTKMIEAIGFDREEVYICNTVKCRPPDNRDPRPEEKEACKPYLLEQIEIIRPQILVGLGKHACAYLTGLDISMGRMRKTWHGFYGTPVLATYHPAFLLRSPGFKKQAWEDLQMLMAKYRELNPDDQREMWKKK